MTTAPPSAHWFILVVVACACGRTPLAILPYENGSPASHPIDVPSDGGPSITPQPPVNGKCQDGLDPCGKGDALRCYDLSRSKDACGACGHACAPGIACQAGTCQQYRCKGALSFKALAVTWTVDKTGGVTYYTPALGDFDGDGILDLVGVPEATAPMSLLYGAGNGTFPTRRVIDSAANWSWQALAADLDGDGFLDLTSMNSRDFFYLSNEVTVRRGSGNRNAPFGEATGYPTSNEAASALLADLDADGRLDLVAGERGVLEIWRGQAGGRFEHQAILGSPDTDTPFVPNPLQITDWNGDGNLDLLYGPDNVHLRLGRGDGSFDPETTCALAMGSVGDLDHDGRLDLVNGTGFLFGLDGCHASKIVPISDWPTGAWALADLNGDDNLDLVADSQKDLSIRVGDGKGAFPQLVSLPGTDSPGYSVFLFGDLNRDGKLDIVLTRTDGWRVFLNTCP